MALRRVLLVDDSPAMRMFIRRALIMAGLDYVDYAEAANGREALEYLGKQSVDLVLCDISMPVMTGEEFLAQLKTRPDIQAPPVLVVSTDSTAVSLMRMMELGAAGYLRKPFTPEAVWAALDNVLSPSCGGKHAGRAVLMDKDSLVRSLDQAVRDALQTMYFSPVVAAETVAAGSNEQQNSELFVLARFRGTADGSLEVSLREDTARKLAANFLGGNVEETGPEQLESVCCELTNMICGATVSLACPDGRFELSVPEIQRSARRNRGPISRTYALDSGLVHIELELILSRSAACIQGAVVRPELFQEVAYSDCHQGESKPGHDSDRGPGNCIIGR